MDNMDEFFGAFDDGEAAASEPAATEETPATEDPADTEPEAGTETGTEGTEEPAQDPADEPGEEGAEEDPADDNGAQDQTFTVQIGEEEHQYTLEEITELARKGAGYDDLQARLDEATQTRDQLQTQLDGQQGIMDILGQIAEKSGKKDVQELVKQLYINFRKGNGVSEDAAALELENAQLKKQMDAGKPAQQEGKPADDGQARARREIAEFKQLHPGVQLNDAMVAKLKPDVQKGMSLANAYQKMLNEQKAAELAEQERKAKAKEQNAKNRANSPGSQQDSGGKRQKSGVDDFFAQFS